MVHRLHKLFLNRFDQVWIPDIDGKSNLSGILSHKYSLTEGMKFIGPLSRFQGMPVESVNNDGDVLVVLSGPEPQRTVLEKKITGQAASINRRFIIVQGKTESYIEREEGNIRYHSYMKAVDLAKAFGKAGIVIARSGYSTIMDMCALGKKAIFIPTPGQTEQEYLAGLLSKQGMAVVQGQEDLDLQVALNDADSIKGFPVMKKNDLFSKVLWDFVREKRS
jgi:uncharacterized protein (TIGR00661 family)